MKLLFMCYILLNAVTVFAKCCPRYHVASSHRSRGKRVCLTGEPPKHGRFCGRGRCNIFGCNCSGGCMQKPKRECYDRCSALGDEFNQSCFRICYPQEYNMLQRSVFPPDFWKNRTIWDLIEQNEPRPTKATQLTNEVQSTSLNNTLPFSLAARLEDVIHSI